MSEIRICHLTHTDVTKDSRILKELRVLIENFNTAKVYAIGLTAKEGPKGFKLPTDLKVFSMPCISRRIKPRFIRHILVFTFLFLYSMVHLIRIRPHILHCHDTLVLPIGAIYKIFTGCKLIYDAHELESHKNGQTWVLQKVTIIFERIFWHSVNLFITVSDSIEKFYMETYGKKDSLVILNSPEIKLTPTSNTIVDVRQKLNFRESDKIYVYIGIFARGRGIEMAIEAFEKVSVSNKLVFIGWGPLDEAISKSERYGENIFIQPPISHDLLPKFASTADFGLCMLEPISRSDYFALPNKLFEYAFAGVPVIASDFPDLKKIVTLHNLGTCFAPNVRGLTEVIKRQEHSDYDLEQKDLDILSWERQAQKLTRYYSDLLEEKSE